MITRTGFPLAVFVAIVAVLWPGPSALAKPPADKITVTGLGLDGPVEITDAASLAPFDPWTMGFIDWNRNIVNEFPPNLETYEVSFYFNRDSSSASVLELIFVFQYSPDPLPRRLGYIYIPNSEVDRSALGHGAQWNPNKWLYATPSWGVLMRQVLLENDVSPSTDGDVAEAAMADSEDVEATPASPDIEPGDSDRWLLAFAALGLLAGAASLVWLRARPRVARPLAQG